MILRGGRFLAAAWLAVVVAAACRAGEPTLAEEAAFKAAVAGIAGAVVRIEPAVAVDPAAETAAAGPSTGLVVDPDGSILATTFAVPEGIAEVVVVLPGGERRVARTCGRDRGRGVVLLRTESISGAPRLEPVPHEDLRPGQWTVAVGRGWPAAEPGVTVGILSATDRCWGLAVQTDAVVSPMNYGGPLLDIAGRVIGLIVPLPADTAGMKRGSDLYDSGIGFAIPLVDLLPLVSRLRDGDTLEPGLLGIAWASRDSINGEPEIAAVTTGSPAGRAGVRPGDRIVAIDGRPVRRIADARHAITPRHAGEAVTIEVERAARGEPVARLSLAVTLAGDLPPGRRGVLGIMASPVGDATRVAWLLPDGPAAAAGVLAGDVVASVAALPIDGAAVVEAPSPAVLAGVLAGHEPGTSVRLEVERAGRRIPLDIELAVPPADVPAEGPPPDAVASPLAAAIDPVKVIRLDTPDSDARPLAILPRGGDQPIGLLIHFGTPRGPLSEAEAAPWKAAVASTGVAVILPGSSDRARWSRDDIPAVVRSIQTLNARRPIDPARIAVSGSGAGAAFAWLVAERLGAVCRGVAVVGATLPRSLPVAPAAPGETRWILLGEAADVPPSRLAADRRRLETAGHVVGTLAGPDEPSPAVLCRWVSLLGLL
jgi:serine protease Do